MEIEIVNYIKEARKHGLSDMEIKQNLLDAGWDAQTVEDGFSYAKADQYKPLANRDEDLKVTSHPEEKRSAEAAVAQPAAVVTHTQTTISETHFTSTLATKRFYLKSVFWILIAIAIAAGIGGYFAYGYFLNNPAKTWNKYLAGAKDTVYKNKFKVEYVDNNSISAQDLPLFGLEFGNIDLSVEGDSYIKYSGAQYPEGTTKLKLTYGTKDTNFSTGLETMMLGNKIYLKVGDNVLLKNIFKTVGENQDADWVMMDLDAAKTLSEQEAGQSTEMFNNVTNQALQDDLKKILEGSSLVKMDKYLGKEYINGVMTFHYSNSLDKQAVKEMANKFMERIYQELKGNGMAVPEENKYDWGIWVNGILDKFEVKDFETWIGAKDYNLYRVRFVSNMPSVVNLIKGLNKDGTLINPLLSAQEKSRDAKRLADVRQISSALELYFNDHNGYPAADNGSPVDLTPLYLMEYPTPPITPDGNCSEWYNPYWYEPQGERIQKDGKTLYSSYKLTFCLGAPTGGYPAGIAEVSPKGITGGLPCTGPQEHCVTNNNSLYNQSTTTKEELIKDFIEKWDFGAELRVNLDYSDYGIQQQLTVPENYLDLTKIAQKQKRDTQRLNDIRKLASALELYFNDKNTYPNSLSDLTDTYGGPAPQAPIPADGSCNESDNEYQYTLLDATHYEITFCLGMDSGGYIAGKHKLSPMGIQ